MYIHICISVSIYIYHKHFEVLGFRCVFMELLPFEVVCPCTFWSSVPSSHRCIHTLPLLQAHTHAHAYKHSITK